MTKIMTPVTNPRTGKEIFPTYEPGTELGWGLLAGGTEPFVYALDQYRYVVFKDPNWDWHALNTIVTSNSPTKWTTTRSMRLIQISRNSRRVAESSSCITGRPIRTSPRAPASNTTIMF